MSHLNLLTDLEGSDGFIFFSKQQLFRKAHGEFRSKGTLVAAAGLILQTLLL